MSRTLFTDTCCKIDLEHGRSLGWLDSDQSSPRRVRSFAWESPELNPIPMEECFYAESEKFAFDGSVWHIETYPIGLSVNVHYGRICLLVRRVGPHAPRHHGTVSWRFSAQKNDGDLVLMAETISQQTDVDVGPIEWLPLSEACNVENNFLQGSKITMLCEMQYVETTEEAAAMSEMASIEADDEVLGTALGKIKTSSVLEVSWPINVREMPLTVGYYVTSRVFRFEDRTYRIRLYPNGQSEYESECISLVLVISESNDLLRKVKCKIGLKRGKFEISEEHGLKGSERLLGPIKFWHRSEVKRTIEAFCTISTDKVDIL